MRALTVVLLALAGCTRFDASPAADVPDTCEAQVYADPRVKDILMKSVGSDSYARQHAEELRYAKLDASHRCMQRKGLLPPGGGVERPNIHP